MFHEDAGKGSDVRSRSLRRFLSLLLIAVLMAGSAVACRPPTSPVPVTTERKQAQEPRDGAPSETPETPEMSGNTETSGAALYGGRAVIGITQEPDFLDPHLAVAAGTKEILFNLFEGLVKLSPEGELLPCLCKSWRVEDEGRSLVFQLRDDVRFHHGEKMKAEDVVWSIKRAAGFDTGHPLIVQLSDLTEVRASDDGREVAVKQRNVNPDLISFMTCAILPSQYDRQQEEPVGTGPFRFVSYTPQQELTLARFADYHEKNLPYLDELSFRIFGSMDAAMLELMSGQIDLFPYLTEEKAKSLAGQYRIESGSANMVQLMAMNNSRPPLDQPLVRQALELAIDRGQLIHLSMGDWGTALAGAMSPAMGTWCNPLEARQGADPEKAAELLREAGFADGLKLQVEVPANYIIHVDTANILAAQVKKAGIDLEIIPVDWATWLEKIYSGRDYQLTIIALTFEYTPSDVLNRYASRASNNFINFSNERYDELVELAGQETDARKRQAYFWEMQEILYKENASCFLQDPMSLTAARLPLQGYRQYPAYIQDLSTVYYSDKKEMEDSRLP